MALPNSVIFRYRVNANAIKELRRNGVGLINRAEERQAEIIEGHKAHKGIEYYFADGKERENSAGWIVGGSGITMLAINAPDKETKLADPAIATTLEWVPNDLARAGFFLSYMQIVKVPGEQRGMGFLELIFEKDDGIGLDDRLLNVLNRIIDGDRRSVWVYWNPIPETFCIPANTVVTEEALGVVTDHRNLHCQIETVEGGEEFLRWYSLDRKTDPSTTAQAA